MAKPVNCLSDYRYQVDLTTPDSRGVLATPAAGAITGIKLRLSATETGAAIHSAVGNLAATEATDHPGRFYVEVDAALQTTHLLPLGVGESYWGIWSKPGDFDVHSARFIVADRTQVS